MKKTILALLLLLAFCFTSLPVFATDVDETEDTPQVDDAETAPEAPVLDPAQGADQYDILMQVVDIIKYYGLYSSMNDDPLEKALVSLFQEYPEMLDLVLQYMMYNYDERSMYIPADIASQLEIARTGYVGIGVTMIYEDDIFTVSEVQPGASAERAGILPGDVILSIDGKLVEAMGSFMEVSESVRGEADTYVTLTLLRDGVELTFTVLRQLIGEREFYSMPLEDNIYYMRWSHFSSLSALNSFYLAVEDMASLQCGTLIIDLRGNSGGLLSFAYAVVDALIPKEEDYLLISYREGDDETLEYITSPGTGIDLNQIVILCDEDTASASEVIMSGLCDTGNAISVGAQTYGKATGQYELSIPGGAKIILTAMSINSIEYGTYDQKGMSPSHIVNNYTVNTPAEKYLLPDMPNIYPGIYCDEAVKINAALVALNLIQPPEKPYIFSRNSLIAINNLRAVRGLEPVTCLDASSRALINKALSEKGIIVETVDAQLEKAIELLREYAGEPLKYTLDENGRYVNNSSKDKPAEDNGDDTDEGKPGKAEAVTIVS